MWVSFHSSPFPMHSILFCTKFHFSCLSPFKYLAYIILQLFTISSFLVIAHHLQTLCNCLVLSCHLHTLKTLLVPKLIPVVRCTTFHLSPIKYFILYYCSHFSCFQIVFHPVLNCFLPSSNAFHLP